MTFLPRPIAAAALAAFGLVLPLAASAQTPPAPPAPAPARLEPVLVRGLAAATDRALDDQQNADNILSVVRSDGIGRLPDTNAAEALQRVPGLSIERDQGEGRYVRIRGLGPDLNAVTINGALVPSPESDRRAVALDVLPASLIGALEVVKTLTPEMDANSLGGTVNVKTLSAFDLKGRLLSVELGAGHNRLVSETSPYGSLVWSDRFLDGKLGVALGFNAERRRFGSDNVETGGAWDGDALEEFERRDYSVTRKRVGGAFNLEYRPSAAQSYYLRALASEFGDDEIRLSHIVEFADPQLPGALGDAESAREIRAREETQRIVSVTLGTEQRFGDWKLDLSGGVSRAEEDNPGLVSAAFGGGDFSDTGFADSRRPRLLPGAGINGADAYELEEIEFENSLAKDREHHLKFDLAHAFGDTAELKFGAKLSRRSKTNEQTTWVVDDFGAAPLGLPAYAGPAPDYRLGDFGPSIRNAPLRALLAGVDLADFIDDEESTINDYRIDEDLNAAYLQGTFDLADWRVITGLRVEDTRRRASGTGIEEGEFAPISVQRKDRHWLPGLHLRRDLDDDTALRAAWSNSVVRPTFEQLAPGFLIDGDEAAFGNPDLRPLKSRNLDVGIERRLGYAGVLSVYGFHKRISNFSYQTDLAGTGRWTDFSEAVTFVNGERASVHGLELAYSQSLRFLPEPWGGLLLGANATFSRSDARIGRLDPDSGTPASRSIPLPSQSDTIVNLVLGYEVERFSVRLAANYKSKYLLEVSDVLDAERDLYVDAQTQFDLVARVSPSRRLQLSFEVLNLNDEPYYVYSGAPRRNAQWETYGRTFRLGLKYSLD